MDLRLGMAGAVYLIADHESQCIRTYKKAVIGERVVVESCEKENDG